MNLKAGNNWKRCLFKVWLISLTSFFCTILSACGNAGSGKSHMTEFFAMDTYMSVKYTLPADVDEAHFRSLLAAGQDGSVVYPESGKLSREDCCRILDTTLQKEVRDLEALFSVTMSESDIARLNKDKQVRVAEPTGELVGRAIELCEETEGKLDITIYPVLKAWGFTGDTYRVPAQEEIAELLKDVNYRAIRMEGDVIRIPLKTELDLGAVAKGYTGMRLREILREAGVTSAICSLGGNVQAIGNRPDGTPWQVAIQAPGERGVLCTVAVTDRAVITSGGYERYFEEEGKRYCHILDPADGHPAESGLLSATVIGVDGTMCDAFSTALYVMGEEEAIRFWQQRKDFDMILYTEEGELILTPDLEKAVSPQEQYAGKIRVVSSE